MNKAAATRLTITSNTGNVLFPTQGSKVQMATGNSMSKEEARVPGKSGLSGNKHWDGQEGSKDSRGDSESRDFGAFGGADREAVAASVTLRIDIGVKVVGINNRKEAIELVNHVVSSTRE